MTERMRVLTVRQPWADAIAVHGKRVENRTWSTKYRGPVAILAGRTVDVEEVPRVELLAYVSLDRPFSSLGGVVAVVDLVDVHHAVDCYVLHGKGLCSPWAEFGAYHWVLKNVRRLERPYPMYGSLGLRWLPEDDRAEILARLP